MTDCTIVHSVEHPELRRTWTIRIAFGLFGLGLAVASMLWGHSPEPNECKPGPGPVIAQVASPTTLSLELCSGAGPKHSPR